MKERLLALRPYILRFVGYPLFFMFWFVTFVYVTFPYDRLKEAIVAAIEAPRRTPGGSSQPSNMQVSIGSVRPTFFPGISARDVALTFLPTKTGERSVTMRMQRVAAHVGLFALAGGNVSADIAVIGHGHDIPTVRRDHVHQSLTDNQRAQMPHVDFFVRIRLGIFNQNLRLLLIGTSELLSRDLNLTNHTMHHIPFAQDKIHVRSGGIRGNEIAVLKRDGGRNFLGDIRRRLSQRFRQLETTKRKITELAIGRDHDVGRRDVRLQDLGQTLRDVLRPKLPGSCHTSFTKYLFPF